ncbi:MAG TPA: MBL fold metallo-hydrolase [Candidatus Paceibacterota bacterium]|jgi:L-ascorbate metabolism protein UlaG (beta-lactamase superfamily)|nr:MBL fold metallo-hydrolase [Candidatus Paceibacterota bacterium]
MVISYLGGECFKVSLGDLTLAINPPGKSSKLASAKFGADLALVSLNHEDFNGTDNASFGERQPFVIQGPGEYEVKGVAVRGFGAPTIYGKEATINTIYSVSLEGMNLCFLGAMGQGDLPAAAKQELDEVDILFVPVGGGDVLGHAAAYKLAVGLEPKVIIPMHYEAGSLKSFLKEAGAEATKPEDKLTVKKKDLEGKEGEVVVLSA